MFPDACIGQVLAATQGLQFTGVEAVPDDADIVQADQRVVLGADSTEYVAKRQEGSSVRYRAVVSLDVCKVLIVHVFCPHERAPFVTGESSTFAGSRSSWSAAQYPRRFRRAATKGIPSSPGFGSPSSTECVVRRGDARSRRPGPP